MRLPRRGWIGALLLVAVGAIVALRSARPRDLLSNAVRLAVTQGVVTNEWTYSGYYNYYHHTASWFWLSDSEILTIGEVTRESYRSARINLSSGKITRSEGRYFVEPAQDKWDKAFYWTVSPDGKWILYTSAAGSGSRVIYAARRFDDGTQRAWTNQFEGGINPTWLSDSSGFIQWAVRDDGNYAKIHTLTSGEAVESRIESAPLVPPEGLSELKGPFAPVPLNVQSSTNAAADFVQVGRAGNGLSLKRFQVSVPPELRHVERNVFISPRGDRLAWLVYFKQRIPRFSFVREYPFVETFPRYTTAVLVSRIDAAQMHVVGAIGPGDGINTLAWTPGGRRLSFVYAGSLWTVSAE